VSVEVLERIDRLNRRQGHGEKSTADTAWLPATVTDIAQTQRYRTRNSVRSIWIKR
jgi:hypothetical protein